MPARRDPLRDAFIIASVVYILAILVGVVGDGVDGHAYWAVRWPHPYSQTYGDPDGFYYSPVVAQVFLPLTILPWPVFHALLVAGGLAALYYLVGRWAAIALLFPPVAIELFAANLNLILAAAIVVGFRHPASWALPILTKVAPGIGVLWFPLRREWRRFAIAVLATCAIVAVSYLLAPGTWADWVAYLRSNFGAAPLPNSVSIPFVWRLPIAVVVMVVGAATDRRWMVPIACMLATPVIWPATLALLLACPRLSGDGGVRGVASAHQ